MKWLRPRFAEGPMLFNLANDMGEQKNLIAGQPETAKRLEAKWKRINAEMMDPLFDADRAGRAQPEGQPPRPRMPKPPRGGTPNP